MRHISSIALLVFAPAAASFAQGSLPSSQPTALAPASVQAVAAATARRHLQVLYNSGLLTIHAENASLNGILREIASATGMSVTGGVTDERVFGIYGPADTGTVLENLLAGTGSNMLLEESTQDRPLTLVLTPRQGGPSPPGPSSFVPEQDDDRADLPPQQVRPVPPVQRIAPPDSAVTTPASTPGQTTTQSSAGTAATAGDTTSQQSPNGVKTPQQIYDQLMRLKQQSQAPPQ